MSIKSIWLGATNVGKTSLVAAACRGEVRTHPPTMGIDMQMFSEGDLRLACWDTSGQRRFETVVSIFIRDCKVVVLVYDVNDPTSLEAAKEWYERVKGRVSPDNRLKIYMVGNKMDLEVKVDAEHVSQYCEERRIEHFKLESRDQAAVRAFMRYIAESNQARALEVDKSSDTGQDCCAVV